MDRRLLLKLMTAAAASCGTQNERANGLKIVVAGAGIIGASIAYHLTKAGAAVIIIDKEGPATHSSQGTFAWINATWAKQPRAYHTLSQEGVSGWGALQQNLSFPVRWGGSLEWFSNDQRQNKLAEQIDEQIAWGEPAEMLAEEAYTKLEPNLDFNGVTSVAYSANDGAVDPMAATYSLLDAAITNGAVSKFPCTLTGVLTNGNRLNGVETNRGTIKADRLILATGAAPNAARDFAGIELPQRTTPGVIVITVPTERRFNRIIAAPGVHMHQRDDGRIVLGEQSGAPQNEAHAMRLQDRPTAFPSPEFAQQHASRILSAAEPFSPGISTIPVENVYIGWRPLPLDGHPVLGASPARPDVYLAVTHSGVTLAPIIGQLAANELVRNEPIDQLDAYRPGRTFKSFRRY